MPDRTLSDEFGAAVSQLTDGDIKSAIGESNLIFQNHAIYSEERVKQASYELTLLDGRSLNYGPLPEYDETVAASASWRELSAYNLRANGSVSKVVLNPFHCCLIRTREQIALPDNVVAKVLARGQLFQQGLIVESTYIDPGFKSTDDRPGVHLMVFNATQRAVTLQSGMSVARLELFRLGKDVEDPHGGANTVAQASQALEPWPWPDTLLNATAEAEDAKRVRDLGAWLIAMDRQAHAIKALIGQVDALRRSNAIYKLFLYWAVPWILWLTLSSINADDYLSGSGLELFQQAQSLVGGFRFWLFTAIVAPALVAWATGDAKTAFKALRGS